MWIKFSNNVAVNMETVIRFVKKEYGNGILFHCTGAGFVLEFADKNDRDKAFNIISEAIGGRNDVVEIDLFVTTE